MTERGMHNGQERRAREPEQWHLSKSIQISHIFTTVTVVIGAVLYIADMKQQFTVADTEMKAEIKATNQRISINEASANRDRNEMLTKFTTIDTKLDVLMQRTAPKR